MLVKDIMSRHLFHLEPHSSVSDAARIMADEDIGSVPVCEPGVILGMVTDRDIVVRCLARGEDPEFTQVGAIMTQKLVTVEPEAELSEAADIMASHQVRRIPVAVGRRLVGMISVGDLARAGEKEEVVTAARGISADTRI